MEMLLTTVRNMRSEVNADAMLATDISVVCQSIAQAAASTFARIEAAELVVQPWADVGMAGSKNVLVDDITVRGIPS